MSLRLPLLDRSLAPSLPYPRGWYVIAESEGVAPGDVKPVTAFGRDLVVFRTQDGEAHVTNAYCPHLGAHLGYGGTIVGNHIRCPFHGWQFEGKTGTCVKAAHGDPVPLRAEIRRWHVDEQDGVILVWFHEEGAAPHWHVTPQPDFALAWTPWRKRTWELEARIQDVAENDADISHSPAMHYITDELPQLEMEIDGPICELKMNLVASRAALGLPNVPRLWDLLRVPKSIPARIEVRRSGFSVGLIRQWSTLPGGVQLLSQTFITTLPIDDRHVRVVARHRVKPTPLRRLTSLVLDKYAELFDTTFDEDVVIWKHKIYRMRPLASKSDWSVLKLRKWARQFYGEGVYEDALRHEDELRRAGTLP
jgi:nitrite reductase/ring-hydroxylating ferredoxin subunit